MNLVLDPIAALGRLTLGFVTTLGELALFAAAGLSGLVRPPFHLRNFSRALMEIGYSSLPVVALTAVFTGMVLALQSYVGFSRFDSSSVIASVVVLSLTRELG
ncbi:MAG: ABC transporter permease, partial [Acidiphilium sp. 21-66-27]